MFYFAYGSCMNEQDFNRSIPQNEYKRIGLAELSNYTLAYNSFSINRNGGVLDIESMANEQVIGILYEISEKASKNLDVREGAKYQRKEINVLCNGIVYHAYTYVIKLKTPTKASIPYSSIVYHTMKAHNFPKAYIDKFVRLVRISAYGSEEAYFQYKEIQKLQSSPKTLITK